MQGGDPLFGGSVSRVDETYIGGKEAQQVTIHTPVSEVAVERVDPLSHISYNSLYVPRNPHQRTPATEQGRNTPKAKILPLYKK